MMTVHRVNKFAQPRSGEGSTVLIVCLSLLFPGLPCGAALCSRIIKILKMHPNCHEYGSKLHFLMWLKLNVKLTLAERRISPIVTTTCVSLHEP